VKGIQKKSKGRLKIVIMSATLDAEKFSEYFDKWVLFIWKKKKIQFPIK